MWFFIQDDSKYKRRAYTPYTWDKITKHKKINQAVAALKKRTTPARLCYFNNETKELLTILHYEGATPIFVDSKKHGLMQVGPRMWIVKTLVKKTNIKRSKKKTACVQLNPTTKLDICVKYIPQDSK